MTWQLFIWGFEMSRENKASISVGVLLMPYFAKTAKLGAMLDDRWDNAAKK